MRWTALARNMTASVRMVKPSSTPRAAVLGLTESAAQKIKDLMVEEPNMSALRISVRTRGCSGNAFHLEYAEDPKPRLDEEVEAYGSKVWVDSTAIMKILGSTMDFVETDLGSEFVFENPNAKGACGCGESFHT